VIPSLLAGLSSDKSGTSNNKYRLQKLLRLYKQ
jgi:hypothetical protein